MGSPFERVVCGDFNGKYRETLEQMTLRQMGYPFAAARNMKNMKTSYEKRRYSSVFPNDSPFFNVRAALNRIYLPRNPSVFLFKQRAACSAFVTWFAPADCDLS